MAVVSSAAPNGSAEKTAARSRVVRRSLMFLVSRIVLGKHTAEDRHDDDRHKNQAADQEDRLGAPPADRPGSDHQRRRDGLSC
jgi:hypothetical protein